MQPRLVGAIHRRRNAARAFAAVLVGLAPYLAMAASVHAAAPTRTEVLKAESLRHYVETFNAQDQELYRQHIPNAAAWDWLRTNVPLFECPDPDLELTYYFRWWTYRKHIRQTPAGFVITEFLPNVPWAAKFNTISCAAGHHFYEGRWIADPRYLDDYAAFWFRGGGEPRRYSFWAADALRARHLVSPNAGLLTNLLADLVANFEAWEKTQRDTNGLFWQEDGRDGMEVSVGGSGYRVTINSYMYGDATAIAGIADLASQPDLARRFRAEAERIKRLVQDKLWDEPAQFFKVAPRGEPLRLTSVREQHGLTPWYFNLPDARFDIAWKQLMDPQGFSAPFGATTTERRHAGFQLAYTGHECQWNGPSWPYSTAVTLTALANVLNCRAASVVSKADYLTVLRNYALSHRLKRPDGSVVPWIDENLNPLTGDWIARTLLMQRGNQIPERGKDYNHSTFCDVVISGLIGLRPRADDTLEVNPLAPDAWDYFCLDKVRYHGRLLTIVWDKTGTRYGKGQGLRLYADGKEIASSKAISRIVAALPAASAAEGRTHTPAGPYQARRRLPHVVFRRRPV
jgi:hypothetical protein